MTRSPDPGEARRPPPAASVHDASAVDIVGVSRRFGAVAALDDVSLTVKRGEFFSLLGPSGCGKTTLLRIIGGFESPTSGDVRLHGRSVVDEPPYLRRTNMIFQHLALFPHMTVFGNIAFGLEMKRMPKALIRDKVDRVLALVRLEGLEGRGIDQLSGGQRQRVAMARALVNEPEVLLLDEPLGALDLQLRLRMQDELRRLHKELGSTFIFVTHDQGEAITMSDRIAVMNGGKLLQVGAPAEVYEDPGHRFVAEFMGHANMLPGTVMGTDGPGRCSLACGPFTLGARARAPLAQGAAAVLVLRYEKVEVEPASAAGAGLRGIVADLLYMGATLRAEIRLDGHGPILRADMPTSERSARLHVGQAVTVSWARDSALAVAA